MSLPQVTGSVIECHLRRSLLEAENDAANRAECREARRGLLGGREPLPSSPGLDRLVSAPCGMGALRQTDVPGKGRGPSDLDSARGAAFPRRYWECRWKKVQAWSAKSKSWFVLPNVAHRPLQIWVGCGHQWPAPTAR